MGNFYGNITLATADGAAVVNALRDMGRDAYVSIEDEFVVVFDEVELDTRKVNKLLAGLTRRLGCVGLAVANADDDVLAYSLSERGRLLDEYDSNPGYDTGRHPPPKGGDARLICAASSRPGAEERVQAILHSPPPTFEVDRHKALVAALGLPESPVGMGFGYIAGGAAEDVGLTSLLRIGDAPEP